MCVCVLSVYSTCVFASVFADDTPLASHPGFAAGCLYVCPAASPDVYSERLQAERETQCTHKPNTQTEI